MHSKYRGKGFAEALIKAIPLHIKRNLGESIVGICGLAAPIGLAGTDQEFIKEDTPFRMEPIYKKISKEKYNELQKN